MKAGRKNQELRLPAIQVNSKTHNPAPSAPESMARLRPSSLNKVQDLEKKLFSKLDAYEAVSRKGPKGANKKGKRGQSEIGAQAQGYERLQKLMPGLYSRLIQAKKGGIDMTATATDTPASYKSLASFSREGSATSESLMHREEKKVSMFITRNSSQQEKQQEEGQRCEPSSQEMEELYSAYMKAQNLLPETSSQDLQQMGESLMQCERDIAQLTRSMQGLVRDIGMQCLWGLSAGSAGSAGQGPQ